MSKIPRIALQELQRSFRSTGYVLIAFVVPVALAVILAAVTVIRERSGGRSAVEQTGEQELDREGYVDQAGLIDRIPDDLPPNTLIPFETEAQAQDALRAGQIAAYYLIPLDYLERGIVYYVYPDNRSYLEDGQAWVMDWTLTFNLLDGDALRAAGVWNPTREVVRRPVASPLPAGGECSRPGSACKSNDLVRYFPSIMAVVFFMFLMISSTMLFNSLSIEKENQILEVLLLTVTPRQLLAGKILGLGAAALGQVAAWLGAVYVSSLLGGPALSLPENFGFPADILIWGAVFFIGGYGMYASLMIGTGVFVPKMKEGGLVNGFVLAPLFLGYLAGLFAPLAGAGSAPLVVALSLFPLTAPIVMVMRLSDGAAPFWQALLAAGLTYGAAWWMLRSAANLFQAQNLLSGQPFSAKRFLRAFFRGG